MAPTAIPTPKEITAVVTTVPALYPGVATGVP